MRLERKLIGFFALASLGFAWALSVSSRRAVHSVLLANIENAAKSKAPEIARSLRIGLSPENREALDIYLTNELADLGAVYLAAVDPAGRTLAQVRAANGGLDAPADTVAPDSPPRERVVSARPIYEVVIPAYGDGGRLVGGLRIGIPLDATLETTRGISRRVFWLGGSNGVLALLFLLVMTRLLIAQLRRREEQLRQTEKLTAVGQLAAGIAHEINNPLGSILGFSQAALKTVKDSDPIALPLRGIEEEALRCKTLVGNLLTFSRQSSGLAEDFDLDEAVSGTLTMISAHARVRSVEIRTELGAGKPVHGDKNQIQQVVINLCSNAIDAMPKGGRLTLRTGRANTGAFLEVEDDGIGIPKEIQPRVFEPFFTTKEIGQGTGLGLALVHEIVAKHRGSVELRSEPGRGTVFRVLLPAKTA